MRQKDLIGRAELIDFPQQKTTDVPARIDTGARTSSVWASNIKVTDQGKLSFCLFGEASPLFKKRPIVTSSYEKTVVASSVGAVQVRFKVKLRIIIKGRRIISSFTLSDRSQQVYPVLIGRNALRGKFIVDVKNGVARAEEEKARSIALKEFIATQEASI